MFGGNCAPDALEERARAQRLATVNPQKNCVHFGNGFEETSWVRPTSLGIGTYKRTRVHVWVRISLRRIKILSKRNESTDNGTDRGIEHMVPGIITP